MSIAMEPLAASHERATADRSSTDGIQLSGGMTRGMTNPFNTPNQSTPSIPLEIARTRTRTSTVGPDDAGLDLGAPENASSLPKPDEGKAAWLFLVGATAIEVLIWGIPFSIGILHAYWTDELFKGRGASTITLASTLQTGLLYMVAALSGP